jgi:phospholipase/carboxylesterase
MGVSYGGDLALLLALRHPSLVGAAFPVAARAFPQWLAAAVPCAPGCPPIRALHGDADATVPPGAMAAAIPRLRAAGHDATLQTYPGIAHDFAPAMEADFVAQATRTICVMLAQCPAPSPDSSMP